MPPQRPLFEKVLDLVVYAPVGLALQLRVDVPTLVASGRTRVHERVQVARWVGEMAVTYFQFHASRGFWPTMNGGEVVVLFCFTWLYLSAAGGGPLSVDAMMKKT